MHTAIIYTIGQTHRIYIDLTPEEAAARWATVRARASDAELVLEAKHGYKEQCNTVQFEDELEIWGDAAKELREISDMFLAGLGATRR